MTKKKIKKKKIRKKIKKTKSLKVEKKRLEIQKNNLDNEKVVIKKIKKQPTWEKSAVFRVRAKLAIKLLFYRLKLSTGNANWVRTTVSDFNQAADVTNRVTSAEFWL